MSKTALVTFALIGKLAGQKGGGPAPVLNTAPLPDFKTIYYAPENRDDKKREIEANRRRTLAARNRGAYGLHGAPSLEPEVRFDPEDYVVAVRGKKNNASVQSNSNAFPTPPKVDAGRSSSTRYMVHERDLMRGKARVGGVGDRFSPFSKETNKPRKSPTTFAPKPAGTVTKPPKL